MKRLMLSAATFTMIACPAFGTITVGVDVTTGAGKIANALKVTAGTPWTGASLFVELTQGSVINLDAGLGGIDTAPSQGEIDANPDLLFDTYVGRVGKTDMPLGGGLELGGTSPFDLGPTTINALWVAELGQVVPVSDLSIANLVFSEDAAGTWSFGVVESFNAQAKFVGGTLSGGVLLTDFLPGDLDVDGFTGISDLGLVLSQWNTDGSADPRADPSGDSFVGIDDLNAVLAGWNAGTPQGPWAYSPAGTAGDLDGDGFVGLDDLNILLSAWQDPVTPGDLSDPSGDGFVGLDDYNVVSTYWNNGTPPIVVVPEPTGLVLLSFVTLGLLRKRRA